MERPQPHRGPTSKLFVTAALTAALCVPPAAAAQSDSASADTVSSSQSVSVVAPDPAPTPVQPAPDPVPAPAPASSSPGVGTSPPPAESTPPEPAAPAPEPAAEPVVPATPATAAPANDPPVADSGPKRSSRNNARRAEPKEKDRSTPIDKINPVPVISEVGPLVEGLRARATEAAPPVGVAALALLTLALTSAAFLLVATRRTGAWRT
jgi:hypothetical protein